MTSVDESESIAPLEQARRGTTSRRRGAYSRWRSSRSSVRPRTAATSACCTRPASGHVELARGEKERRREAGLIAFITREPAMISPLSGLSVPAISRSSVDAPHAGGPAIAVCVLLAQKHRETPRSENVCLSGSGRRRLRSATSSTRAFYGASCGAGSAAVPAAGRRGCRSAGADPSPRRRSPGAPRATAGR